MAKFKVGEKVDVRIGGRFHGGKNVRVTVVDAVDDEMTYRAIDDHGEGLWIYNSDILGLSAEPVAVAPATATLTIEAGKFYKTRDGRKVGPMYASGKSDWPWASGAGGADELWRSNGNWYPTGNEDVADLIAEWVAEPAAVAEATAAIDLEFVPFPQVGDSVLIPGWIAGITNSARGTNYNIVFETQNRRMSLHFLEEDFIVDPEQGDGDCPCANDNGPAPSTDTAKAFDAMGAWLRSLAVSRAA